MTEITLMSVLFCDEDTPCSFLAGRNPAELTNEELIMFLAQIQKRFSERTADRPGSSTS